MSEAGITEPEGAGDQTTPPPPGQSLRKPGGWPASRQCRSGSPRSLTEPSGRDHPLTPVQRDEDHSSRGGPKPAGQSERLGEQERGVAWWRRRPLCKACSSKSASEDPTSRSLHRPAIVASEDSSPLNPCRLDDPW